MITQEKQIEEYVKCFEDKTRIYFIENYFKTYDATVEMEVAFRLFPKQREYVINLSTNQSNIVLKPRQSGYSTVTCAFIAASLVFSGFNNREVVLIIANKLDMSKDDLLKIKEFLLQVPRWFWGEDYYNPDERALNSRGKLVNDIKDNSIFTKDTLVELWLFNGAKIYARSSGPNASRGISACSFLFLDEAAFIEKGASVAAAAIRTTGTVANRHIMMVSTPNLKDELYYPTYHNAQLGLNNYKITYLKWYHDPRFNKNLKWYKELIEVDSLGNETKETIWKEEEVIDKKGNVKYDPDKWKLLDNDGWIATSPWFIDACNDSNNDPVKIAQELLCSFIGSGNVAVDPKVVEMQKNKNVSDEYKTDPIYSEIRIWKPPISGHKYILGCLPGSEMVLTDCGLKRIEDVGFKDKLVNEYGEYVDIINRQIYDVIDEDVYSLKLFNTYRTTTFTSEHPILYDEGVLKRNYKKNHIKYKFNERYWDFNFSYTKVKDLKKGGWLKIPNIYRKSVDDDINHYWFDDLIKSPLYEEKFWWVIGLYLGDGNLEYSSFLKNGSYRITFSFNSNEIEYINKLKEIIEGMFLSKPWECKRESDLVHITFESKCLFEFILKNFGQYCDGKFISEWVKYIPNNLKYSLVKGYFNSDGSIKENNRSGKKRDLCITFGSINLRLLESFQDILFSLGLISSFSERKGSSGHKYIQKRLCCCQTFYDISINNRDSISLYKSIYSIDDTKLNNFNISNYHIKREKFNVTCFFNDDKSYIYIRIRDIKKSMFSGVVYNFECDTHSFMCHHIVTHNCDVSRGDAGDNSAFEILDVDAIDEYGNKYIEQVVEFEGKITGDILGDLCFKYGSLYNNALAVVDCIGGYGESVVLTLLNLEYPNLYYENIQNKDYMITSAKLSQYISNDEKLPGFHAKSARTFMISTFSEALKNNLLRIRSIRVIGELETWVVKSSGKIEHLSGCHDDTLMALSMAMFVYDRSFLKMEKQREADAEILKAFITSLQTKEQPIIKNASNSVEINPNQKEKYNAYKIYRGNQFIKSEHPYSWLVGKR